MPRRAYRTNPRMAALYWPIGARREEPVIGQRPLERFCVRRNLVVALACAPLLRAGDGHAQRVDGPHPIGFLSARRRPASLDADYYGAFPKRLGELGYAESRDFTIEWRFAEGRYDRLAAMADELVRRGVEVIVGAGPPGASAAQKATTSIPIVFIVSVDPVLAGYVRTLARPGGNMTGIVNLAADLASKHLEMLRAIVPGMTRVAVMVNDANPAHTAFRGNLLAAAGTSGLDVLAVTASSAERIAPAFDTIAARGAGALVVALDPLFIQHEREIARLAIERRIPSIFANREYAQAGGLMAYGQNQVRIYRRVAEYVDRILRGARVAELPVEQPTELELVINATTAKAIGVDIPASLSTRAEIVR